MNSIALVSLPGARLDLLAKRVETQLGLALVSLELSPEDISFSEVFRQTENSIFVLPSNFVELGAKDSLRCFQDHGGVLVFVDLPWEESWKAVANDAATNAEGLPWRKVYRQMAQQRAKAYRALGDLVISGVGSLDAVASELLRSLSDFRTAPNV